MRKIKDGQKVNNIEYRIVDAKELPLSLLLEADPSEKSIRAYLKDSWCYAAFLQNKCVAASVVKLISSNTAELFNISVHLEHQKQKIGTHLLKFVISDLAKKSVKRIELGTGTFGYQLAYYQAVGFRVDSIVKDHFLLNYSKPIFEQGIQHKDMLRLYLNLR